MTKQNLIEKIAEQLGDHPYTPESVIHQIAVGALNKLSITELDALLTILTFNKRTT